MSTALPSGLEAAIAVLCMDLNASHIYSELTAERLALLLSDRAAFLKELKQLGGTNLIQRQEIANGLAKLAQTHG